MELSHKLHLSSHLKSKVLTRNQRFKAALARNHSKIKQEGRGSIEKKCKKRQERRSDIQKDAGRLELLNWIREIQDKLDLTCKEFANVLGVSEKTVVNWRGKVGYMPTLQNFRKLLELEKLTRHSVTIIINKNSIIRRKPTIKLTFI